MTIMVRVDLTEAQWTALRKLALDRKVFTSKLLADALLRSPVTGKALKDAA